MVVITTTITTYPTSASEFYACNPELLTGSEAERRDTDVHGRHGDDCLRLNLGTAIPPNGTYLVIHSVGGRWCFRYDG